MGRASKAEEMTKTALPHVYSGKVRELYEVGHDALLMVASDRISVFDVVLPDEIPDKGRVLTALSSFWFDRTSDIVANHVISCDPTDFPETAGDVGGRAALVRATRPIGLECVVRGYVFGHGWQEYSERGTVGGFAAPKGLRQADRLPVPLFTPTTKADAGHDLPLTAQEAAAQVGADVYEHVKNLSLRLYEVGAQHAETRGLILADTKFEFGELDGQIIVIDEMMTPDSSRYWPTDSYRPGSSPPSFDKQYVRDYMDTTGWNHEPPAPRMPESVIANTRGKYVEAYELLTDLSFDEWYSPEGG
jgi:phosphoribosylaminoimidazole-succinocarboxamide synthase